MPLARRWMRVLAAMTTVMGVGLSSAVAGVAGTPLTRISNDPYHNSTSQHKTEVEPDTFAFGSRIVSGFQVGRFYNGGASNIGWATSSDGGATWTHGFLNGTTVFAAAPGIYARVSDASVAYDARHRVWMISYLGLFPNGNSNEVDVLVSRSTDGGLTWGPPLPVNTTGQFNDKNWTVCDDTSSSRFYGHCYTEFDNASVGDRIEMSTTTDGGRSWSAEKATANRDFGIGGQPLVQPNGRVIVPINGFTLSSTQPFSLKSFVSSDGGGSWSRTTSISEVDYHIPQGVRATIPLPSAEIDASGTVYVVWSDCRFEGGCNADDIVMTTSQDGVSWSDVQRLPIGALRSGADHFIPGLAVDRTTSGSATQLALTYYFYPIANCQTNSCELEVGFISSTNGGSTWTSPARLAGPMFLSWLPLTTQGYMVGDYISTSIVARLDQATPVFASATPPTGTALTCIASGTVCHEAIYSTPEQLAAVAGGGQPLGSPAQQVFHRSSFTLLYPPTSF